MTQHSKNSLLTSLKLNHLTMSLKSLSLKSSPLKSSLSVGVKTGLIATVLSVAGLTTAQAVTALPVDQTVSGTLTEESLTDEYDDTPYNLYLFQGVPGDYVQISMQSSDVDSYLVVGGNAKAASDCADCTTDDDSGGELDSQLLYVVPEGGNVYVRAGTVDKEYGRYKLSAKKLNNPTMADIQDLRVNTSRSARLTSSSALTPPGRYFDLYMIKGEPNTLVSVLLNSDDFDTYLAEVSVRGNDITEIDYNDDANHSDNGTDSRLKLRLDDTGKALVQATAYENLETGRYTLQALPINEAKEIKAERRLRKGQVVNGRLESSGQSYLGDYYFDAYNIVGLPGERIEVTVSSDDFDTVLNWGYMRDGKFVIIQENDDAEDSSDNYLDDEDTDSKLTIVLDRDGKNVLMVTSYEQSITGSYRLTVNAAD